MTNNIPVALGDAVAPGEIKFYDARLPPLEDGPYQLQWKQQVVGVGTKPVPPYTGSQAFLVQGPRFTLAATEVQSVYPPANAAGDFTDTMPHIVFPRSTLPWERYIDKTRPKTGTPGTPWIALLLLTAEELDGASATAITVKELLTPTAPSGKRILPPAILPSSVDLDSKLNAIDVPIAMWTSIAPTFAEVPYLAHAREINTEGKEILGINENGVYAVVIGNRLVPSGLKQNVAYTALIVSLEGHADHLPVYLDSGGAKGPAGFDAIRLAVLASWSFTATAGRASFSQLMQALPSRGGVSLLQYPHAAFGGGDANAKIAQTALDIGFVPLENNTRSGEGTTSWYRGPLTPAPTNPAAVKPVVFSDAAIRYDPATGLFDASYAVGWQVGRLLALADSSFAQSMLEWRRSLQQANSKVQKQMSLTARLPNHPAMQPFAAPAPTLAPADVARTALVNLLDQGVGKAQRPKVTLRSRRGDPLLAGALSDAQVAELAASGEDPLSGLVQRLFAAP